MSKVEEIKKEIEEIIKQLEKLYEALICTPGSEASRDLVYFICNYDRWYTRGLQVIKSLSPDRYEDFVILYRNDKRKGIDCSTYTLSDALKGLRKQYEFYPASAATCLAQQISMLKACYDSFDSKVYDLQTVLQADIFDSEIDSARYLLKNGFLRAAGAICGVVLEKHLAKICENHNLKITKKDPSLATYSDALKDIVYDTIEWRRMQRLADLRNLCDHNKDREPTKEEVEELISDADRVIKSIF